MSLEPTADMGAVLAPEAAGGRASVNGGVRSFTPAFVPRAGSEEEAGAMSSEAHGSQARSGEQTDRKQPSDA